MTDLIVTNGSVVLRADQHDPGVANPHRLVELGIVPSDWRVVETTFAPLQGALVVYENGTRIDIEPNRLLVTDDHGLESSTRFDVVRAYIQTFHRLAYGALGLNLQASLPKDRPAEWLSSRLNVSDGESDFRLNELKLSRQLRQEGPILNLHLGTGVLTNRQTGVSHEGVLIECNVHHAKGMDLDELCEATGRWPEYWAEVLVHLEVLIGDGDD